jgi:hypothetical protein
MVWSHHISFGGDELVFHCQEHSSFSMSVLLFLLLLLVFIFALICVQIFLYLFIKVYFCLWSLLVFIKRGVFKKVQMVLEKRKSFMQKSGTRRSLFRLRIRLLHVMFDVILIVCLVIFVVAWLVSNNWDSLMSLWKNHALFLLYGSIILVFSLMLYLGWLGACSHMLDSYKVANSLHDLLVFDFWCHLMLLLMSLCRFA